VQIVCPHQASNRFRGSSFDGQQVWLHIASWFCVSQHRLRSTSSLEHVATVAAEKEGDLSFKPVQVEDPTDGPGRDVEILIVESNPADTRLTVEAFKAAGLKSDLRCVDDGEDALLYLHQEGKYSDVALPDLIFLNLSLEKVAGLEVLKAIKSSPEVRQIPIVVASGTDDPELVRAVYSLNSNCFIRKPNELTQFLRFVETCYAFWARVVTLSPKKYLVSR
jgi:chemotaxis family two-component system response regulator Rcp1